MMIEAGNDNDRKLLRGRIITRLCDEFARAFPKAVSIDPDLPNIDPSQSFRLAAGTKDMSGTKFADRNITHFILHIPLENAEDLYLLVPLNKLDTKGDPQKVVDDSFEPVTGRPVALECIVERNQEGNLSKVTPRDQYTF
ncbi:MAG: hypothetical protein CMH30_01305 [Micavibrio sp.]|nr:hypothetical protein [Micavibrio sp.]|tara:strand:+ start:2601 stop:3020 length:420 start_codon:yes stop_codon:yes gene_type:complete